MSPAFNDTMSCHLIHAFARVSAIGVDPSAERLNACYELGIVSGLIRLQNLLDHPKLAP